MPMSRAVADRSVPGAHLAGLDRDRQAILCRWQRTGRVGSDGAGRRVRLVEIEDHPSILRRIRMQEPTGAVGGLARRRVAEDEEELRVSRLDDRVQTNG